MIRKEREPAGLAPFFLPSEPVSLHEKLTRAPDHFFFSPTGPFVIIRKSMFTMPSA